MELRSDDGYETCPECGGSGVVEVTLEEEYCGRDTTITETCRVCFGSGRI